MSYRPVIAFFVALLVLAGPLLACVPTPSMTPAEVECCKKMAGNCDMGGGNHKCCNVKVSHSAPVAAIMHGCDAQTITVPAIVAGTWGEDSLPRLAENIIPSLALVAPSPPGFPTVLKL